MKPDFARPQHPTSMVTLWKTVIDNFPQDMSFESQQKQIAVYVNAIWWTQAGHQAFDAMCTDSPATASSDRIVECLVGLGRDKPNFTFDGIPDWNTFAEISSTAS